MAIDLASVIGSCSTGSAAAVDSRTRDVAAAAVPRLTQGIERAHVAVVGRCPVAGRRVRGLPLDRDVGVLGHVEGAKTMLVGERRQPPAHTSVTLVKSTSP